MQRSLNSDRDAEAKPLDKPDEMTPFALAMPDEFRRILSILSGITSRKGVQFQGTSQATMEQNTPSTRLVGLVSLKC